MLKTYQSHLILLFFFVLEYAKFLVCECTCIFFSINNYMVMTIFKTLEAHAIDLRVFDFSYNYSPVSCLHSTEAATGGVLMRS